MSNELDMVFLVGSGGAGMSALCIDRAHALLVEFGQIDSPSQFGQLMVARGIVTSVSPRKCYTRQGLALIGGLWLAKLYKAGRAERRLRGKGLPHAYVAVIGRGSA